MSTPGLTTAQEIFLQKQKEHAGLQALRESSALLLQRVEQLAEMSNIMADGGEGEFLSQLREHRIGSREVRPVVHEVDSMERHRLQCWMVVDEIVRCRRR
jgi:hypothetical protein